VTRPPRGLTHCAPTRTGPRCASHGSRPGSYKSDLRKRSGLEYPDSQTPKEHTVSTKSILCVGAFSPSTATGLVYALSKQEGTRTFPRSQCADSDRCADDFFNKPSTI